MKILNLIKYLKDVHTHLGDIDIVIIEAAEAKENQKAIKMHLEPFFEVLTVPPMEGDSQRDVVAMGSPDCFDDIPHFNLSHGSNQGVIQ